MSYEVRDGVMYDDDAETATPVDVAVAEAIKVLEAAGWTTRTETAADEYDGEAIPDTFEGGELRTVARSPWREVPGE